MVGNTTEMEEREEEEEEEEEEEDEEGDEKIVLLLELGCDAAADITALDAE